MSISTTCTNAYVFKGVKWKYLYNPIIYNYDKSKEFQYIHIMEKWGF